METTKAVPLTPTLLREEAKKVLKYMREPGVAPWVLEWMAAIIDVGEIGLELPCPECGKPCRACSGAHPAYNIDTGCVVRIVIVDYLCPDCPHVWAVWSPVPLEEKTNDSKPAGPIRDSDSEANQEPSGGRLASGAGDG